MSDDEIADVLAAYRQGKTCDLLQAEQGGRWGVFWAVPPCSPEALQKAARQFVRECATCIRYIRHARLVSREGVVEAVIVTTLPERRQSVYDLHSAQPFAVPYLTDAALIELARAFEY